MLTATKLDKVASVFEHLANKYTDPLHTVDMACGWIYRHPCQTIACHAGWYRIGRQELGITPPGKTGKNWYEGALLMAEDLGFDDVRDLKHWAHKNPKIWGNPHGFYLLGLEDAFGSFSSGGLTLRVLADHWKGVARRYKAAQLNKGT